MRVAIVKDEDSLALLDALELAKFTTKPHGTNINTITERHGLTERELEFIVGDIHRRFHYIVTGWLQKQGLDIIKR